MDKVLREKLVRLMVIDSQQRNLQESLYQLKLERDAIVPELIGEVVGEDAIFGFNGTMYHLRGDIDDFGFIKISKIDDLGDWRDK